MIDPTTKDTEIIHLNQNEKEYIKSEVYCSDYGPAAFAGYLIKAETNPVKILPKFLFYITLGEGYENWKNSVFTQATIQNIGADKYSQLPVTLPHILQLSY